MAVACKVCESLAFPAETLVQGQPRGLGFRGLGFRGFEV